MQERGFRLLHRAPRLLGVVFALFTALFALDVFESGRSAGMIAVALAMHLVPTLVLLMLLAVSWFHDLLGAVIFTGLGLLYIIALWGRFHWSACVVIAGPLLLIGSLFLANWLVRRRGAPARRTTSHA